MTAKYERSQLYQIKFLEVHLFFNYIDVTHSLLHTVTHGKYSYFSHISVVVDQFGSFLQFCHRQFDKEDIYDG